MQRYSSPLLSIRQVVLTCAVVLTLMATLMATGASADSRGFHCEDVWTGPSKDNDLAKCMTDTGRVSKTVPNYVLPALCIIFLVLSLLIFPVIFCCCVFCQCRCCCACCREVPKESRGSSRTSRQNVMILLVVVMCVSIAVLALLITGSSDVISAADAVFTNLNTDVLGYFRDIVGRMETAARDPVSGNLTDPIKQSNIDTVYDNINTIGNNTEKYHSDVTNYAELAGKVGYGVAVLPFFLFSFGVIFALCNCRVCCPSCFTWIYFLFGIIFAILGFILLLLSAVFGDLCAEIDLQTARQPGLMQWYAIPTCQNTVNFTDARAQITDMQAKLSGDACKELANYCSPSTTYNPSSPSDYFYCTTTTATAVADCPSFAAATAVVSATFVKTGTALCGSANCSFVTCATDCTDTTVKQKAQTTNSNIASANRLLNALDIILPLMDCNVVIDRVFMIFKSCPKMRDGLLKMGIGLFMTLVMIVVAWIVMFRGQKLWFSQIEYDEGDLAAAELKVVDGDIAQNPVELPKM